MRTKKEPLFYSEGFKKKCKELYPNNDELHKRLDNNRYFVGRYLDDCFSRAISIDAILLTTDLGKLQEMARLEKIKGELYSEWDNEVFLY